MSSKASFPASMLKIGWLERTAIVRIDMTTSVHWIGHNPNLEAQGSEVLVPRDEG